MANNKLYLQQELDALYQEERFLNERQAELFNYHPKNPNKVDVVGEYDHISEQLTTIGMQIRAFEIKTEVKLN